MTQQYNLTIRANGTPVFKGRESVHGAKCKAATLTGTIRIESDGALLAIRAVGINGWRSYV